MPEMPFPITLRCNARSSFASWRGLAELVSNVDCLEAVNYCARVLASGVKESRSHRINDAMPRRTLLQGFLRTACLALRTPAGP